MEYLFCALGTRGDLNPMLAIGAELHARGHRVVFLTNDHFSSDVLERGMIFVSLGGKDAFDRFYADPRTWDSDFNCLELGYEDFFSLAIEQAISAVDAEVRAGHRPIVITLSTFENGAAIAAAAFGLRQVRVILSPNQIPSDISPPAPLAWAVPQFMPVALRRRMVAFLRNRGLAKTRRLAYVKEIDRTRESLGAPVFDDLVCGEFGSDLNIALFPEWFSPPAPDAPRNIVYTDFLLCGSESQYRDTERALAFASLRGRPLVATQGSAVGGDPRFLERCREISQRLEAPLIFVRGHGSGLCERSDDSSLLLVDGVDLGRLLPGSLALIHHGGIGTLAHGLSARVPQVVRPHAFDQFDNGHKLECLGLGACILDVSFKASHVSRTFSALLRHYDRRRCALPDIAAGPRTTQAVCDTIASQLGDS